MFKNIALILVILVLVIVGLYNEKQTEAKNMPTQNLKDKKILVVYYSTSGSTEKTANLIQKNLQCDIKKITLKEPYTDKNTLQLIKTVKGQIKTGYIPEIEDIDISDYDVIFVGSPVWAFHVSLPVKSFLLKNNFENKTIVPFYSVGAIVKKSSLDKEVSRYTKSSNVLPSYITRLNGFTRSENKVKQWLDKL